MNKALKIFLVVLCTLAILSLLFILLSSSKKKSANTNQTKINQQSTNTTQNEPIVDGLPTGLSSDVRDEIDKQGKTNNTTVDQNTSNDLSKVDSDVSSDATRKESAVKQEFRQQWQKCKDGEIVNKEELYWNIQVTEPIPDWGTYAKGLLDNDQSYPVRVIIKSDATKPEEIKEKLVAGKLAYIRSYCSGVADDGSVILQTF